MKRANKGFTLTELLLSFMILGIVLTGILALFASGMLLNESNQNLSYAASHAQYVMEDIRWSFAASGMTISNLKTSINTSGSWNWNSATIGSKGMTAMSSETITTTASDTDPPCVPDYVLDVVVTVSWQDRKSRSRTEHFETLISNQ